MFQSARWCVETFQLKQLIVFHFLFQVCDPLSRTASVTTVSRSNHLLVLYKVTCNQKGFYRNHQLRKLPTSTFQQVIWLSLRLLLRDLSGFRFCLLVAALRLHTDLVFLEFRLQIWEICVTFGLNSVALCLSDAEFQLCLSCLSNFIALDWPYWLNWLNDSVPPDLTLKSRPIRGNPFHSALALSNRREILAQSAEAFQCFLSFCLFRFFLVEIRYCSVFQNSLTYL